MTYFNSAISDYEREGVNDFEGKASKTLMVITGVVTYFNSAISDYEREGVNDFEGKASKTLMVIKTKQKTKYKVKTKNKVKNQCYQVKNTHPRQQPHFCEIE